MSLVAPGAGKELARLLAPVDPQAPAGLFDVEDETYQAIDQEMVKLGGLQEASIDWAYIEEAACQYLAHQCKHLRIVAHLSAAWLRSGCWQRWGFTLALLAGVIERYWETACPKPGPTGFIGKRKLVGMVLTRLIDAMPRLDRFTYDATHFATAQDGLRCLQSQRDTAQLDATVLADLERLLGQHAALVSGAVEPARSTPCAPSSTPTAPLETVAAPMPRIAVGNERETRRAVLGMAELINRQDPYDPTGYQLRRFGLWAHIQTAPQARQDSRTELMAVPQDIVGDYEEAIAGTTVDAALLLRIEKSVTACPYWIRGSYLAAAAATRLAMGEVAEAIRCATGRFVLRVPALQALCFSDGSVFVDDQCLAWLKASQMPCEQDPGTQEFASLREEMVAQLESAGVESVLLKLQGMQTELRTPRERCHTTLIAADLLAARGVSWLAQDLFANVAHLMQHTTASAWEPEVFRRLQQSATPPMLADRHKESR
ncbi:type VI secretion system protein TssA [Pseudomonas cremoricolorata]|uniref:Membrane protein n=1 Tax=Pseudomonas cremoricolorata TaxID=157783 RepID=A0A089WU05_9PSED|nr:type VI secretion system protein TssA [Pseudomonas cremoricolorata]AIR90649.1 membrane protein [Pseudomonas cremoricolorata]